MKFPELYGKRIKLIELSECRLDEMYEYSKNSLLYKYFEFQPQNTIDETRKYLHKLMKRSESETGHYWFVGLIEPDTVIGSFGVHDIDWRTKDAEISYGLSPDHWGKGYFNETLIVALNFLFQKRGFYRIVAKTSRSNIPSIKALERVGFKKEGILRHFYLSYDGERYDAVILSILRPEFEIPEHNERGFEQ